MFENRNFVWGLALTTLLAACASSPKINIGNDLSSQTQPSIETKAIAASSPDGQASGDKKSNNEQGVPLGEVLEHPYIQQSIQQRGRYGTDTWRDLGFIVSWPVIPARGETAPFYASTGSLRDSRPTIEGKTNETMLDVTKLEGLEKELVVDIETPKRTLTKQEYEEKSGKHVSGWLGHIIDGNYIVTSLELNDNQKALGARYSLLFCRDDTKTSIEILSDAEGNVISSIFYLPAYTNFGPVNGSMGRDVAFWSSSIEVVYTGSYEKGFGNNSGDHVICHLGVDVEHSTGVSVRDKNGIYRRVSTSSCTFTPERLRDPNSTLPISRVEEIVAQAVDSFHLDSKGIKAAIGTLELMGKMDVVMYNFDNN